MPTLSREGNLRVLDLGDDENRFTIEAIAAINRCLDEIEADPSPVALITTASGRFFSNGLDTDALADPVLRATYIPVVEHLLARFLTFPVPTIAAINGHAFGGGALLAMAHDFRVMRADRGFFCFPEVDLGMGFTPLMSALVADKVTPQTAVEAMTTGRRYGGPDAWGRGLVDATASEEELVATAAARVRDLAGKDRRALGQIKAELFGRAAALAGTSFG